MRETLAQHAGTAWAVACTLVALLLAIALLRGRAGRRRLAQAETQRLQLSEPRVSLVGLDAAELTLLLQDAEKSSAHERLPPLYLSLAQCRLAEGEAAEAEELLRKSIRGAAGPRYRDIHAKARVVLGDIAHANGDLTTACEHWQIARALFHELRQTRDHSAVEARMLKNGCPTDWVLTDF
jgi:tetratricopeptide (TPR) repeat protein